MQGIDSKQFGKNAVSISYFMYRIHAINSAGLYQKWLRETIPNGTACDHIPSRIFVTESYTIQGLWVIIILLCFLSKFKS